MLKSKAAGLTLIELMVSLSVLAVLLVVAAPGLGDWLANTRIRNTAEALSANLQFAKGEAVARNARVRLQLTDTLGSDCDLSAGGPHWVVNLDPTADANAVLGACDAAVSDQAAPRILAVHDGREGGAGTAVTAVNATSLVFNGLGRLTPVPAGDIRFNVGSADADQCAAAGGPLTCLRVVVSPVGQISVCNPNLASSNPQGCPP